MAASYCVPKHYDYINAYNGSQSPSTVHVSNTRLQRFFQRYLLEDAISVFNWNMPETWSQDYFLYGLYCYGFMAIVNTDKYGIIPQHCTLTGYDVFYRPTNAIITNPLIRGTLQPRIGRDCTLIKLQPDYGGIMDLVGYYADMMALCAEAAGVNLLNSKLAYVFFAANKAGAESFKKLYDKIASGEPAAVVDKDLISHDGKPSWDLFSQSVGGNYIVSDVLMDLNKLVCEFRTQIGLPNANTDKKGNMTDDEVNSNNVATYSKASMWLEQLQESCQHASDMFGIDLSVKWRYDPDLPTMREEGADDGKSMA